jgi:hypothetical protein
VSTFTSASSPQAAAAEYSLTCNIQKEASSSTLLHHLPFDLLQRAFVKATVKGYQCRVTTGPATTTNNYSNNSSNNHTSNQQQRRATTTAT